MNKTVYILGAGFSMNSGAPSQAGIIKEIYDLNKANFTEKQKKIVNSWITVFDKFLKDSLCISDDLKYNYTLEDIYTPIDKALAESTSFRDYVYSDLISIRDIFNRLIILAIRNSIDRRKADKYPIEHFAKHIVDLSRNRLTDEKNDAVSVITTNWDIILDNKVYKIIQEDDKPKGQKFAGVVDYCCYISSIAENDETVKPGLYAIGKGCYNVKILKLHGSLNWLQCPKCHRLYTKFFRSWNGGYVFSNMYCRHCERNFGSTKIASHKLNTNLITPTFLKNLNNIQNKLIWQNAGIELAEASKVVFMGYSLPHADYEFKQLLAKMIRTNAKIEVILTDNDNPKNYTPALTPLTAGYRYENFFSGRTINISYNGINSFINKIPVNSK